MIQPNELRIGNYVYLQKSDTPYRITEIGWSEIERDRYEATGVSANALVHTFVDNMNPIAITEKILLNCGFVMVNNREVFRLTPKIVYEYNYQPLNRKDKCYFVIVKDEGEFNHVVPADNAKGCSFIPIKSFHQLQNLFFSLSGKELKINL